MSEPTYRVELTHHPENGAAVCWRAAIYWPSSFGSDDYVTDFLGRSREHAFELAQTWVRGKSQKPDDPSTVYLTEDGDILDPHDPHDPRNLSEKMYGVPPSRNPDESGGVA